MNAATTLLALASLALLTACDLIRTPGSWQPAALNDRNLGAMAADPRDLLEGQDAREARGEAAALPVAKLLAGKRPLIGIASTEDSRSPASMGPSSGGSDAANGQP